MRERLGTWVGLDANGVVQAGHAVYDDVTEDEAKAFVSAGGLAPVRVGPAVAVWLGDHLPAHIDGGERGNA